MNYQRAHLPLLASGSSRYLLLLAEQSHVNELAALLLESMNGECVIP